MPLELDGKRIAQLFSNLLSNALTHGQADETVNVKASIVDGQFRLQVSNSGTPIPEASLASLFLPFSRGREDGKEGLGLGLYISAEIAKAHGGRIEVSSDDQQTVFTVLI
ncbi:ATP-binding protein [Mucilaginibacter sp. 21P]|uniref:sensor histidine kinase n=1 Tax=Mucilaginibacter sp. 21P TaxID=2778902 RepID=UPI001C5757D7|nr:ATP-binding protein [Mucilaginibacter sp. 21P]QXV65966.1 ATP-binding protein [Mucilaginibacter sp. 21P]